MEKLLSQRQQGLHTYDPPCPLHLARVMKAPTRPLSKKRDQKSSWGLLRSSSFKNTVFPSLFGEFSREISEFVL